MIKKIGRQRCLSCPDFDSFMNYCGLHYPIDYFIKKVAIKELKTTHNLKIYYPLNKCNKPKNIREFVYRSLNEKL